MKFQFNEHWPVILVFAFLFSLVAAFYRVETRRIETLEKAIEVADRNIGKLIEGVFAK